MTDKITPVAEEPIQKDSRTFDQRGTRPTSGFFKAVSAVVWKDVQAEVRSRELFSAMLVFSLLMILIFNFALELDVKTRQSVTAGVLWATFAFAGTLGLNRSMAIEKDRGCLDGLLLAPVDRSAIYFGKVISNLAFMLIVELIVLPVYSVLYNVNLFNPGLLLVILLGSIGYAVGGHPAGGHVGADPHARHPAAHPAVPGRHPGAAGGGQSQQRLPDRRGHDGDHAADQSVDRLRYYFYRRRIHGIR